MMIKTHMTSHSLHCVHPCVRACRCMCVCPHPVPQSITHGGSCRDMLWFSSGSVRLGPARRAVGGCCDRIGAERSARRSQMEGEWTVLSLSLCLCVRAVPGRRERWKNRNTSDTAPVTGDSARTCVYVCVCVFLLRSRDVCSTVNAAVFQKHAQHSSAAWWLLHTTTTTTIITTVKRLYSCETEVSLIYLLWLLVPVWCLQFCTDVSYFPGGSGSVLPSAEPLSSWLCVVTWLLGTGLCLVLKRRDYMLESSADSSHISYLNMSVRTAHCSQYTRWPKTFQSVLLQYTVYN